MARFHRRGRVRERTHEGGSARTSDTANSFRSYDILSPEFELLPPLEQVINPISRVDEFVGSKLPYDRREFNFRTEPERVRLRHPGELLGERPVGKREPRPGSLLGELFRSDSKVRSDTRRASKVSSAGRLSHNVAFAEYTATCVRRRVREEVLHAKQQTGRRGRGRPRRRGPLSKIVCD